MSKFDGLNGVPVTKNKFEGLNGVPVNQKLAEPELGDYGQAFVQGAATGFGKLADTAVAAGNVVGAGLLKGGSGLSGPSESEMQIEDWNTGGVNEAAVNQRLDVAQDYWKNDKIAQVASDTFGTGLDKFDHDQGIRAARAGGEFATAVLPFGAAAKGIQLLTKAGGVAKAPWVNKLNNFLAVDINAKNVISFAGAGAGGELAKSEDSNTSDIENIAREVVGGIVGGITAPWASAKALQGIYKIIHPIESLKGVGTSILASTTGGKINKEAVEAAKRIGLTLPPSLATDSTIARGIENTVLKSWVTSKVYNEVMENIPKKIIAEIDKNLDQIGSKLESTVNSAAAEAASDKYRMALQNRSEAWKAESQKLFDNALKSLTEQDVIKTPQTLKTIREMRETLTPGVLEPDGAKKAILAKLSEFEAKILSNDGTFAVRDLVGEQQNLLNLGKYGEAPGYENYYNGLASAITDELAKYKGNKVFSENYLPARAFYRENIIERVRSDLARKILEGQPSKTAAEYMTTPQSVKQLEHILGDHPNAKEIMGMLKRSKISNILVDSNTISPAGEFNSNAFMRMFGRESKEPLLKALMGKNYTTLQDNILPIAKAIETSKKVLANPSGSANVLKDYGAAAYATLDVVYGIANSSVPLGAATTAAGATLINVISRAFASPKYLEKLINKGNQGSISTRLKNTAKSTGKEVLENPATKYKLLTSPKYLQDERD